MSASFTVYVLQSVSTGRCYTGQTADLERRLLEHSNGLSGYTMGRGPWNLVHQEEYSTRAEAMRRERFLKSGVGREWIESILALREHR